MPQLLMIALAGFAAQMVDGSLGMGYGVTSASILLAVGVAPSLVSATANIAQLGTTLTSGLAHHRGGNVDMQVLGRLAIPGGVGGLAGALLLTALPSDVTTPIMAGILTVLGARVILRFLRGRTRAADEATAPPLGSWHPGWLMPLGAVGGAVNAVGGGGWGPVVTSALLTAAPLPPRRVIGTVSAAEFVVTVCATLGFLVGLGLGGIDYPIVLALLLGGVLAAPLAARLAGRLPAPVLGVAVGSLILALNLPTLLGTLGVGEGLTAGVQLGLIGLGLVLIALVAVRLRVQRGRDQGEERGSETRSAGARRAEEPSAGQSSGRRVAP
ncbi:permease [Brachybacterium endophyticum]|uniref:Probable membrane transporter protein n=1 Tax=Brachybacterium endophyticum TaxID=2182385 RepID=A0A2U2RHV6_9MICO|nr:sulfite exporter TauE/SafE family protein [Brachybacterium endophyticum]PWH05434.1 permease [Brachybacterium endophyticum]